ncbi:MAG: efflux RND transporter periplasmic adaptor subunit [Alphaproteobacteria bacterium]|nr:efflux RND transporter periplasmic adaptor subunit [Alphaproteobacteria bacterium]
MTANTNKQEIIKMLKRNPLLMLGVGGLLGAILFSFTYGNQSAPPPNQLALPPSSPYSKNVSGIGIVEANSKNISVGTFLQGIVAELFVIEGSVVKKNDPLFQLDARSAKADVDIKQADLLVAKDQHDRASNLTSGTSISFEEKQRRKFAFQRAEAELKAAKITLDKMTVQAPTDGLILKVNTKVGESVGDPNNNNAIILMGNHVPLHLRVQIDENDAWRFKTNTKATAFLKSNKDIHFPLSFVRIEPYASPKQQISGDVQEFVDTRIVNVIYKIDGDTSKIYIGQQLDVFIETDVGG